MSFFNILHFQLFVEVTVLEDITNEATFTTRGRKMYREALTADACFHRFLLNNLGLVFLEKFKIISEDLHCRAFLNDWPATFLSLFHKFYSRTTAYKFLLKNSTISCFYQLYEQFEQFLRFIRLHTPSNYLRNHGYTSATKITQTL